MAVIGLATTGYSEEPLAQGDFIEKRKSISGSWSIQQDKDGRFIVLGDDFKAKNGPDLKLFLSPTSIDKVTGKTAIEGSYFVADLKRIKGAQQYRIPDDVDLSIYLSLLVHCEKYAVLWGGGAL